MPNEGFNAATKQDDNWRTPDWLFKALDTEFAFDLDGAADESNTKFPAFIRSIEYEQVPAFSRVFCNPPYSNIQPFVDQATYWSIGQLWVFILPVRTRSAWFEQLRSCPRTEFRWLRKRIAFDPPPGVEASSPRMDTFIAIVRSKT